VDADELGAIAEGIQYLRALDPTDRPLGDFEANFLTRGRLEISVFTSSDGATLASVESGAPFGVSAFLTLEALAEMEALVSSARTQLDSLQSE